MDLHGFIQDFIQDFYDLFRNKLVHRIYMDLFRIYIIYIGINQKTLIDLHIGFIQDLYDLYRTKLENSYRFTQGLDVFIWIYMIYMGINWKLFQIYIGFVWDLYGFIWDLYELYRNTLETLIDLHGIYMGFI